MKSVCVIVEDVQYCVDAKLLAKLLVAVKADGEINLSPTDELVLFVAPSEDESQAVLKKDFLNAFKQVSCVIATEFADNEMFMQLLSTIENVSGEYAIANAAIESASNACANHQDKMREFEAASRTCKCNSKKYKCLQDEICTIHKQLNELQQQLSDVTALVTKELIAFGDLQ